MPREFARRWCLRVRLAVDCCREPAALLESPRLGAVGGSVERSTREAIPGAAAGAASGRDAASKVLLGVKVG